MNRGNYEAPDRSGDIWAFIDRINDWYPPETIGLPIDTPAGDLRRDVPRLPRRAARPGSRPATARSTLAAARSRCGAIGRGDEAAAATVVYYHGGGFILGGLDSHDDICAELCAGTGFDVVSVDYRLAPEHLHPAAFDDARSGLRLGGGGNRPADRAVRRERRRQPRRGGRACDARPCPRGRSARC